jgi:nucleoside-diphosphate-sugar epimerase
MSNTLITGATGFVGKNLTSYLKDLGYEINFLGRNELSNEIVIGETSTVIHLAGKAHDLKKTANASHYYEVNYDLTKRLFDAFLKSNAKKFIFISSVKSAADSVEGILTEDIIPSPQTHYGKSKLKAEEYLQRQSLPKGKSFYILRPCMIHGPGNKGNLSLLYKMVSKGIPYPLAAFKNKRSYLSVGNLCFVINELIKESIPSGIYNVADDEPLSTNDVISILGGTINKRIRLWALPVLMVKGVARLGNFLKLPLNSERLEKLTENYVVSNEKIKHALGKKLPIQSKQGLLLTAKSFKFIDAK